MASTTKSTTYASLLSRTTDWIKPHRSEAVVRIRNSGMGFLAMFVFTQLLPLPSPLAAIRTILSDHPERSWWWYTCATELVIMGILALNILQSAYAIKYPRAPLPPLHSPARPKGFSTPQPSAKRRFRVLSPSSTPQRQKAFSPYTSSPISTPSRVLNYTIPSSSSPFDGPGNLSISLPPSPSPLLSAYRGKHSTSVGQPIDIATLSRLLDSDNDG